MERPFVTLASNSVVTDGGALVVNRRFNIWFVFSVKRWLVAKSALNGTLTREKVGLPAKTVFVRAISFVRLMTRELVRLKTG